MSEGKLPMLLSDLDGTLLDSDSRLSEENRRAILDYEKAGGKFGIATGRSWEDASRILEGLPLNAPCILCNGSLLYEPVQREVWEYRALETEAVEAILTLGEREFPEVNILAYTVNHACFVSPRKFLNAAFVESHMPCDLEGKREAAPCLKLFCLDTEHRLYTRLRNDVEKQKIELVLSGEEYLEILPYGVTKGSMLRCLKEQLRRRGEGEVTVCAAGDFYNDISMLEAADLGIAPENALPEVKQAAKKLTVSNDEHAIARIIREIMG